MSGSKGIYKAHFLGFCECLELKTITPMSVQDNICIGEDFQIKVSDDLVHPSGSWQNIDLSSPVLGIYGAFRVQSNHSNESKNLN